jgi:hypothetical protein
MPGAVDIAYKIGITQWKNALVCMELVLLFLLPRVDPVSGTDPVLIGPLLVSTTVNQSLLRLYDLGSAESYQIAIDDYDPYLGSHLSYRYETFHWSPDGCNLLLQHTDGRWATLSLGDFAIQDIDIPFPRFPPPVWAYDTLSLTYPLARDEASSTEIRSYSVPTGEDTLLFTVEGGASPINWLSADELLFDHEGEWYLWRQSTGGIRLFGTEEFSIATVSQQHVISSVASPDHQMIARTLSTPLEDDLDEVNQHPGLQIYFINTGDTLSIDFFGTYVRTFVWSSSSTKILVTTFVESPYESTDRPGIFYYDLESHEVYPVSDYPSLYDSEYGSLYPLWSPDERYITASTRIGFEVYDLVTGSSLQLHEVFDGPFQFVAWSPQMDYTHEPC